MTHESEIMGHALDTKRAALPVALTISPAMDKLVQEIANARGQPWPCALSFHGLTGMLAKVRYMHPLWDRERCLRSFLAAAMVTATDPLATAGGPAALRGVVGIIGTGMAFSFSFSFAFAMAAVA